MINNFSILNVYEKPKVDSKLSSQILYGEKFKVIYRKKNWLKIKTNYDNYYGFIKNTKFIEVRFFENKIKSNKTINLINFFTKNKKNEIYFIMGADNLINFHKWHKWETISQKCNIIVFDRLGYKKKSLNSTTFKRLNHKRLKFIEFNKVNISSSQLRKI